MKVLTLTQGKVALVDDKDYEWLNSMGSWHWDRYAKRVNGGVVTYMHRLIANPPAGMHVDHINGDKLDNRRQNLRVVTAQQNTTYREGYKRPTSSKYKGVSWDKSRKKWVVHIRHRYIKRYLGRYDNELEAAKAYNAKASELNGEFAKLNAV